MGPTRAMDNQKLTTLVLAPHADDEVLGVGGTIAKRVRAGYRVVVAVLTGHGGGESPLGSPESWGPLREECRAAGEILGVRDVIFRELPAARLDFTPVWQINGVVEDLLSEYSPTEMFVPFAFDLHTDHRSISYAASVAGRPYLQRALSLQRVLAYETLSETHLAPPYQAPAFQPNVFVDITGELPLKLAAMRAYRSQLQPDTMPRSLAALTALATLRGVHIGRPAAEAFVLLGEYER